MAEQIPQTYANHTRWDPLFHFFAIPVLAINFFISIYRFVQQMDGWSAFGIVFAAALIAGILRGRMYALKVQDRVIRLEERLRLHALLDTQLRPKIDSLSESQLIALRFASDAEVPFLAAKAIAGNLKGAEIKKAIQTWRPDYWRV